MISCCKLPILRLLLLSTALSLVATAASASPPEESGRGTPAERRFAEIMKLTDAGNEAAIAAYVRENFAEGMTRPGPGDPGILPFLLDNAKRFRGFDTIRTVSSTADQVTMLVRPRSQPTRRLRYVLKVEAAAPYLVEGLFLLPATEEDAPEDLEELTPEAAVAVFEKEVERVIASGGFSGVVLLAKGEGVVLQRAAGEADREHHVAVTAESVFCLASMNKMFTAVAIARLVEQGRVAWDDPVGKHLQGWLSPDLARTVTIAQLLSHTSGLGDYLDRLSSDPKIREARVVSAYRDLARESKTSGGSLGEMRYSNLGYVVLGAVIEAVTGRDYFEFVRSEIFARAGMARTDSWSRDEVVENRAVGYIPPAESEALGLGRGWRSNALLHGARGTPAGGGYSTGGDLLRFARALVEGKLVRRETLEALLKPRVGFLPGSGYAYGFVVRKGRDGTRIFGHAGGFPGINGELRTHGDGAFTLVVLSNVSGGAGEIVGAWDAVAARIAPQGGSAPTRSR